MDRDADFRTWNIFRRRHDEALCCAVLAETPVPTFLMNGDWAFGLAFADGDPPVTGFCTLAAEGGTGLGGFYLFLALAAPSRQRH